jgi:aspartate/methionine/tyrosine aminotransferase
VPAARLDHVEISGIREIFEALMRWAAGGGHPIPFHFGMPDFDTPAHITQAAVAALESGWVRYTASQGLPDFRAAIARKLARENAMTVDPAREIVVTCGANEAISATIAALVNPGDEVIIPDPAWPHYEYCLYLVGATPVRCPLRESNRFEMHADDVAAVWSPRTRMVVMNSPHNPTGAVMSPAVKPTAETASSGPLSSAARGMSTSDSGSVREITGSNVTTTFPMSWKVQWAAVSTTRGAMSVPEQRKRPSGW